jgi:hypothetical protein
MGIMEIVREEATNKGLLPGASNQAQSLPAGYNANAAHRETLMKKASQPLDKRWRPEGGAGPAKMQPPGAMFRRSGEPLARQRGFGRAHQGGCARGATAA